MPKESTDDTERCRRAGIPDQRAFATKPALAQQMLQRNFQAGMKLAWVTGDSLYGDQRTLRQWLERRNQPFVLAVSGKEAVWMDSHQRQVKTILTSLPADASETLSAGAASKGPRVYDWLRLELSDPPQSGWKPTLLIRRSISDPSELSAYIAFARAGTTLTEVVRVAGRRSAVEESSECAKGEVGLDHYQVRSFCRWYRHITLAMWAQAFLSVIGKESGAAFAPKKGLMNRPERSSLAGFKASRGLQSG